MYDILRTVFAVIICIPMLIAVFMLFGRLSDCIINIDRQRKSKKQAILEEQERRRRFDLEWTTLSDGSVHYWLPNMVTINDNKYHKISYCTQKSSYYKKGVKAELRAENADEALDFWTEKISGNVDFN